jgi:hypothetical protein
MGIQIECSKRILAQVPVFEVIVCPQTTLKFVGNLLNKNLTKLLEVSVHTGISPNHGDDAEVVLQTA